MHGKIRAAALSGDCDFKEEVLRQQFNIVGQHPVSICSHISFGMSNLSFADLYSSARQTFNVDASILPRKG